MEVRRPQQIIRSNKENAIKRSLSKRKSLAGVARFATPAKKKFKKFAGELASKVEKAVENKKIEPKER